MTLGKEKHIKIREHPNPSMKLILGVLVMLVVSSTTMAEMDSVTTGPYKISFDLGFPNDSYNVTISPPKDSETLGGVLTTRYQVSITNKTRTKEPRLATIALLCSTMPKFTAD
jgi:hypothetical protein